ncbi:MAG TPA: hypothetical protein VNZ22_12485, partial [Bacillota bacterium]|nr:hypothetical protein [Bacillota bacterium]
TGRRVRADAPIYVELSDYFNYYTAINSQVNPSSIVLQVDGTTVSPTFTGAASKTAVRYQPPAIFASGSTHTVSLSFADNAMPTPNTTRQEWSFTVDSYKTLDTNLMAAPALVSANHGFALRVSQIDANRGPTIQRAENQLAGLLLDPTTGQPYLNRATLSATNEPCVINYSTAGAQGNFLTELPASIPGLPGALPDGTSAGDTNAALDAVTYLYLSPGIYTLGVNSSDGFRLTTASTPDLFAPQIAVYEGVRAAADSTVTFGIAQAGYYPFRICYFIGGQEVVYPTADVPSLEFFSLDSTGTKTLINDTNTTGSVAAFLPAQTLPYVRTIAPSAGETGVAKNAPIDVTLINGTITVQADSIQLLVNGTAVTPTVTMASGLVTVHYQRATTWPLNSTNTIQLAFTDSASNRRTNTWQFTTENVFTQLWAIAPASTVNATWAKWVTSGGTERGLAYNPRTGHVLLVSRNSATGTDGPNACGVGILDGNDGHYIGQLNLTLPDNTTIRANGLGTFKLDMIDVAEDGVIYAGNLTTSGTVPFIIYRWQNESASPTIAYTGNPADLTQATRCGDDFAVRGSGAGTQIIASG